MLEEYSASYWVIGFCLLALLVGVGFGLYFVFVNQPPNPPKPPHPPHGPHDPNENPIHSGDLTDAGSGDMSSRESNKNKSSKDRSSNDSSSREYEFVNRMRDEQPRTDKHGFGASNFSDNSR
jgi:hypothetical protein